MKNVQLYYFTHPKHFPTKYNFGDKLSPFLVSKVLGREVDHAEPEEAELIAIGSIMAAVPRAKKIAVWGTGVMFEDSSWGDMSGVDFLAVRGKLSAESLGLSEQDLALGDPALLVNRYIRRSWRKKYRIGLVPHYVDKDHELVAHIGNTKDAVVIDVFDTPEKVCKQISSCDMVVSSSLHGIIVAHSYGVPAAWVELSDKVAGSGFKFRDYYSVFDRKPNVVTCEMIKNNTYTNKLWAPEKAQLRSLGDDLIQALTKAGIS